MTLAQTKQFGGRAIHPARSDPIVLASPRRTVHEIHAQAQARHFECVTVVA
jgi:hypothetical protein